MLNLVLSRLNSVSLPFLPNRILHLYFPTRITPSYHVLKIITLKLMFKLLSLPHTFHYPHSNFYQDVLSLITTICQIGTICTLSPVPSAVLQAFMVSSLDCFGNLFTYLSVLCQCSFLLISFQPSDFN